MPVNPIAAATPVHYLGAASDLADRSEVKSTQFQPDEPVMPSPKFWPLGLYKALTELRTNSQVRAQAVPPQ
ncbi:MAG: hypothetical protein ACM3PY_21845 [Omnitrophica WOR_2 bacterium]